MEVCSAAALFGALLFFSACETVEEQPSERYEPFQPLYNLKLAYNYGETESLNGIFAPDFEYIAEEKPEDFPGAWNPADEAVTIENIGMAAEAVLLEISTSREGIGNPRAGATTFATPLLETRLRVYTTDGVCLYTRGYCCFDMVRDRVDSPWQIKTWYDKTTAENEFIPDVKSVQPISWAGIKYYFYQLEIDDTTDIP